MKINLPEQNKPAAGAVPSQPRKLKKVLGELPNANMGELTRQTFTILRDLNRQTMPNRDRLEDMEMIVFKSDNLISLASGALLPVLR